MCTLSFPGIGPRQLLARATGIQPSARVIVIWDLQRSLFVPVEAETCARARDRRTPSEKTQRWQHIDF